MAGAEPGCQGEAGTGTDPASPPQAMSMREQIGYPDYILDERNKHLDEEYSNVRPSPGQPHLPLWSMRP